jgi:uncharacterized protein (TIGR00290 family)
MTPVFASWSGGKDCCLALHRAINNGLDVRCLANTVTEDGLRSRSHGMTASVIRTQAEALGIPIRRQPTGDDNYRERFVELLHELRQEGIEGGVFGDIDFNAHREWIDSVCAETGMEVHLPLWEEDQQKLMDEFIDAGFISIIVAVRQDLLGPEFLGRIINRKFLEDIHALGKDITPCGEAGEFHSFVIDGPVFKQRLVISETTIATRDNHHYLEIKHAGLVYKATI